MPLNTEVLENFTGLNTEFSPIGGNRPPNSLADGMNLVLSKSGFVMSRKGHPEKFTETTVGDEATGNFVGLVNRADSVNRFYLPYTLGVVSQIAEWDGASTATYNLAPTSNNYLSAEWKWDTTLFQTYNVPRSIAVKRFQYISAANGLFRRPTGSDNASWLKYSPLVLATFSAAVEVYANKDNNWLLPGYVVSIKALIKKRIDDDAFVEGKPTSEIRVVNNGVISAVRVTYTVTSGQNIQDGDILEIYRTVQFKTTEAPPVKYYKCYESTYAGGFVTSPFDLTVNDDGILQFEQLYTDINIEGEAARSVTPPVSRDLLLYKNYAVYGNIMQPPYASLALTKLETSGAATLTVEGITCAIPVKANSVTAPNTLCALISDSLEFEGRTSSNALVLRPFGSLTTYCVQPYASSSGTAAVLENKTIKIYPAQTFDLTKFESPGIAAITTSAGVVVGLFTYKDVEGIPSPNGQYIEFIECDSFGQSLATLVTKIASNTVFYIPGTGVQGLPVYATAGVGYSLLPTFARITSTTKDPFIDYPIAVIASFDTAGTAPSTNAVGTLDFIGVDKKSPAQLLDLTAKQLVTNYNAARTADAPYAEYTGELATIYFEHLSAGYNSQRSPTFYNTMNANVNASAVTAFEPALTTSPQNIVQDTLQIRNGMALSKYNRPEAMAFSQVVSPFRVGDDNRAILRLAQNLDNMYVFKEDEGIYRVQVAEGLTNPQVDFIQILDNTISLVAPESVQEVNESIVFLSNKGFGKIFSQTVELISRLIDTEIRELQSKVDLSLVRSFSNEFLRLYGCCFPSYVENGVRYPAVTYVFDFFTEQWSKWDLDFQAAHAKASGQLTTITTDYNQPTQVGRTKAWQYIRQDVSTFYSASTQYDESIALTGAALVVNSPTNVTLTRSGSSTPMTDLANVANRLTGKQLWFYDASAGTYTKCTPTFGVNSITLDAASSLSVDVSADSLVVGVDVSLTMNRYFPGGPSTLKQFSEFHVHTFGSPSAMSCSFRTENSSTFSVVTTFGASNGIRDVWRTYIPLSAARGRYIQAKITHSTPMQKFELVGSSYVFKDSRTSRVNTK